MKKKWILIGLIGITIILVIIYFTKTEHQLICSYQNNNQTYFVKTKYIITYQNNIVKKIETIETVNTNDYEFLNIYKNQLEDTYQPYNQLKYYTNKIIIKNKTLISKTTINYEKLNIKKFIELNPNNKILLNNNNQIEIKTIKEMYKKSEIKCH